MYKRFLFAGILCMVMFDVISMRDGGFNMTGAPGEGDCTGCHTGVANSDPNGSLQLTVTNNPTSYTPDSVYELVITSTYSGKTRFGIGLNARKVGRSFIGIGTFLDDTTTSELWVRNDFVTHTRPGTEAIDQKVWRVKWKAPSTTEGPIRFYAATVISNADNSNTGDLVVTNSILLSDGLTGLSKFEKANFPLTVLEETEQLIIQNNNSQSMELEVTDITGKHIQSYLVETQSIIPRAALPVGMYLLKVKQGNNMFVRKGIRYF